MTIVRQLYDIKVFKVFAKNYRKLLGLVWKNPQKDLNTINMLSVMVLTCNSIMSDKMYARR